MSGLMLTGSGPTAGAAAFSPATVSGLVRWFNPESLVLADAAAVTSWSDSSGNGGTVTQGTAANQPVYKTGIKNGLPVVRFATNDFLGGTITAATYGVNTSKTVVVVMAPTAVGPGVPDTAFNFGAASTDAAFGIGNDNNGKSSFFQFGGDLAAADGASGWQILTGVKNGNTLTLYRASTAVAGPTAVAAANVTADTLEIGRLLGGAFGGNYFDGDIGDILLYSSALSAGNLSYLWTGLTARWGL